MSRKRKVTTNDEMGNVKKSRNLFNVVSKGLQEWRKKKRTKIRGVQTQNLNWYICLNIYIIYIYELR
jgi:hypothetical protein